MGTRAEKSKLSYRCSVGRLIAARLAPIAVTRVVSLSNVNEPMEDNMNILRLITGHEHYWGVPYTLDNLLIQTCYECGADRRVKAELQPSSSPEQPVSIAMRLSANNDATKAA